MPRTSIITLETRERARLADIARDARRYARDETETDMIHRLIQAVRDGHVTPRDAHAAFTQLRRAQRSRLPLAA
jgi:uncharacterized membrane protein YjjP (DUF1212 family)